MITTKSLLTPLEQRRDIIKMIISRIVNHDIVMPGELDAALNELERAAVDQYKRNTNDFSFEF